MVKHVTIDLDDETHEMISLLKDEAGLTWAGILIDWAKVKTEFEDLKQPLFGRVSLKILEAET